MSDKFEQWFGGSKYTQVVYPNQKTKRIALDGWNAALSSLQGDSTCEYAKSIGTTEYKCAVKCLHNEYLPKRLIYKEIVEIMEDLKLDSRKAILYDFAYSIMNKMSAGNHAAKIAELEAKLAEVEKDAERYRMLRSLDVTPYNKWDKVQELLHRAIDSADTIEMVDTAVDAAIQESKKGGAV